MNFFRAVKYLKYILLSGHRKGHGIHSPFVFDLVSRIMRNKIDNDVVCCIEKVRQQMKDDHRTIKVLDSGSGQGRKNQNEIRVSDIEKSSPVPAKYCILLSNLAKEFGRSGILELGTSNEISSDISKGKGMVFITGYHKREPVLRYFKKIADNSGPDTVIVIDDIYYSSEMADAWNVIKQWEKVSVTIDVFRMGIVFFREGINHNHYIIRY